MELGRRAAFRAAAGALFAVMTAAPVAAAEAPLKIGFSMALTGGLAANGKAALLAMQLWKDDQNAKGGLLGRPVDLIYYDDQSNPSQVPAIYTKLLDIDKVHFVVSSYGTNLAVPAMPLMIQRKLAFVVLLGLGVNDQFSYDRFFSLAPWGQDPKGNLSKGFFKLAKEQSPAPKTIAIVGADAEFSKNATDGAREHAKNAGMKIVYDRSYPPNTVDFTAVVRGIQAAQPDIVFVGAYPPDAAGMIRAANEVGLSARMFGGGMVGLQFAALETQLGQGLNGVVNYDFYSPEPSMKSSTREAFLVKYQAKAAEAGGVDPLGFYAPGFAYAQLQVLAQAIEGTKGVDQEKVAAYLHSQEMDTVIGKFRFGSNGEWAESGVLTVQFQNVKGNDLDQFRKPGIKVIVDPPALASGKLVYPMQDARK